MNRAALAVFPIFKPLCKLAIPLAAVLFLVSFSPALTGMAVAKNATNSTITISIGEALPSPLSGNATGKNSAKAGPAPLPGTSIETPAVTPPPPPLAAFPELHWTILEPGFELGLSMLPESRELGSGAAFVVLRIDPALHRFSLHMASETGQSHSFPNWSRESGLRAGINASMYLPDNVTSTGYMRNGETVNNKNMGSKLGAIFVAGRKNRTSPPADILERDRSDWAKRLEDYTIVVQNYRLIDSRGAILWPEGGSQHSIAAVAKDKSGRIVFVLSQEQLTAERFAHRLKELPLSLSTVMYVEGGAQAGLFLHVSGDVAKRVPSSFAGATIHAGPDGVTHVWKGRQSLLNTRGNPDALVPNIIGVQGGGKSQSRVQ